MPVKILVVDDEPDLKLLVSQKFRKKVRDNEFVFAFAESGVEALRQLEADTEVDLVMTDINMPEMDGLTLLAKLKERFPHVKSLIVSAYGDMANIRTALNRGAFDFITKPIDFTDLEITLDKTVAETLAQRQQTRDRDQLTALQRELDVARRIQQALVPRTFPAFPERREIDLFAEMIPAREVGGDFYDFFLVDDDHLALVIGDVSGKGVPAALFMAVSKTLLKATALTGLPPHECLQKVNAILCLENESAMFVTVFYGLLHLRTGELVFSNGGHNPPYIVRDGGSIEATATTGDLVLGAFEQSTFKPRSVNLRPGESIFLFTDGVTEALSPKLEVFAEQRLQASLQRQHQATMQEMVIGVTLEVEQFAQSAPPADDLTILALRYLGAQTP